MQPETEILHVGQKKPAIYLGTAINIKKATGKLIIAGLGSAIPNAMKLAFMVEGTGMKVAKVEMLQKEMPGRTPDPTIPDAIKLGKWIATGKTVRVPQLLIHFQ